MDDAQRAEIIEISWDIHSQLEEFYLSLPASKNDPDWLEKQRILLADMAIHLLQTSLDPGELELDKLRNNLHAILTIADQFLPDGNLKESTEKLYDNVV